MQIVYDLARGTLYFTPTVNKLLHCIFYVKKPLPFVRMCLLHWNGTANQYHVDHRARCSNPGLPD
jgi:hypothetical protein